jgi:hypothetical protein
MKFRKKPVVIGAEEFKPIVNGKRQQLPAGVIAKFDNPFLGLGVHFFLETINGEVEIEPGEWIITGVQGERYPCKPDIFEATHEPLG